MICHHVLHTTRFLLKHLTELDMALGMLGAHGGVVVKALRSCFTFTY